jgi:hypothetical protein
MEKAVPYLFIYLFIIIINLFDCVLENALSADSFVV